jgi:GT2 family glycosyltransferase
MDKVVDARNKIVQYALDNDYEYIMWVDSDVIVPQDIVDKLIKHNKSIVSGIYMTIGKDELPRVVHNVETETAYEPMSEDMVDTGLQQASQIGFGCVLTKIDIFNKVRFRCERYDTGFIRYGEDYCFSNDIWLKHDIPVWVDTNIQVPHKVNDPWDLEKA